MFGKKAFRASSREAGGRINHVEARGYVDLGRKAYGQVGSARFDGEPSDSSTQRRRPEGEVCALAVGVVMRHKGQPRSDPYQRIVEPGKRAQRRTRPLKVPGFDGHRSFSDLPRSPA